MNEEKIMAQDYLHFVESLDKVNLALQGTNGLERMMQDVLDAVISIFDCDQAFLMHPCDPMSPTWTVPMERRKPGSPDILNLKKEMPMTPQVAETLRVLLDSDGPVKFSTHTGLLFSTDVCEHVQAKSFVSMALFPKEGKPWLFGIHQYTHARVWTAREDRLFQEISRRLEDGLTSRLAYRRLKENKRAETRLNEQLHFLQQLLDSIPIPVYYKDKEGVYLGCNAAFETFTRLARKDIVGKTVHEVIPKERADKHHEMDMALLGHPGVQTYEAGGIYKDGKYHDVIFNKATFVDANACVAGTVGALIDITDRRQAGRERLANLRFFENMDRVNRAIQEADDLEAMMKDLLSAVLSIFDCDRAFLMTPCDPESQTWRIPMECHTPEYPGILNLNQDVPMDPRIAETLRILLAADGPVTFGPGMLHARTGNVPEHFGFKSVMAMAIYPKTGSPWQFGIHQCAYARVWTAEDIRMFEAVGRRLADGLSSLLSYRDLRNSEKFLDNVVEHLPNMLFVKEARTLRFVRFNRAGERLLGYTREELLDKTDHDFFPKEMADFFTACDRKVLDGGELVDIPEETIRNRHGEEKILHTKKIPIPDETGMPQYLLGISEDITKRKKLEAQLSQIQKMEAIGQLAGGVAHDFNNMLGVIIGRAELALKKASSDNFLRRHLEEILSAGLRSSEITRQLLAFARKQTIVPEILELNKTVNEMLKLLRRLIGEDIDLAWRPGSDLWKVNMDPSQIDQILANLCVNARDAIGGVGMITIETQKADFDNAYCADHEGFSPGEYVMLAVSDNGSGMDKQTRDKIFEPFFTTKASGKGTGLGLATVYGIVKQNAGFINVYSEPGHGTTFKIYLPRYAVQTEQIREQIPVSPTAGGDETILLVEDESAILDIVKQMLEELGYTVFSASTPGEAILIAKKNPGVISLLLTDVVMPQMTGLDLLKELTSFYPEIKCLFMSGYLSNVIAHHGVLDDGVHFIQKPFSRKNLAAKVRNALDMKSGSNKLL